MNRLIDRFTQLRQKNEGALIAYFPIGDPRFDTLELAETYFENGADLLEVAIPVPDPSFDGDVVANSMRRINAAGRGPDWIFREIVRLRDAYPQMPLQVFTYTQIFQSMTAEELSHRCLEVQADAMLIADASEEQIRRYEPLFGEEFANVRFMPYRCEEQDIELIRVNAKGYIFLQAADGVTGERDTVDPSLAEKIERLQAEIPNVSICPGFGVSVPEHCKLIRDMGADGVVVGSLVVKMLDQTSLKETGTLIRMLKNNLR